MDGKIQTGLSFEMPNSIKKIFKIIAINALIIMGLLILLNIGVITLYNINKSIKNLTYEFSDPRMYLPNYTNVDWAAKHFEEFNELSTEYRSYVGWKRLPYNGETINIDNDGIRNTVQHPFVNDSSKLVAFLGASGIWGTGVNDENTLPSHFSKISQGKYRAINFGEAEYNAYQSFITLNLQIKKGFRPDIVISSDGPNMLGKLKKGAKHFSHTREGQVNSMLADQGLRIQLSFKHYFFKKIQLFISAMFTKFGNSPITKFDVNEKNIEIIAKSLCDTWLETKYLADRYGAEYIAILSPSSAIGNPNLSHLNIKESSKQRYKKLYSKIKELLETKQYQELQSNLMFIPYIFDCDDYIYIDSVHLSPLGNKLIAERIYNRLTLSR
jgi:hypothetical protein